MNCPTCGTKMKPLATSMFCPNDCDRKVEKETDPSLDLTPPVIYWKYEDKDGNVTDSGSLDFDDWWNWSGYDTD